MNKHSRIYSSLPLTRRTLILNALGTILIISFGIVVFYSALLIA